MNFPDDMPKGYIMARPVIEKSGDAIWELICDNFAPGIGFKTIEVAHMLQRVGRWKKSTAILYAGAILKAVSLQPNSSVKRIGTRWFI